MIEFLTAWVICDHCEKRLFVDTPAEWEKLGLTWFFGLLDELCPACCQLPEVKADIDRERRITAEIECEFPEVIYE